MSRSAISPEVREFLTTHITSVVELEALLLLHSDTGQRWTAAVLAERLRVDPAWLDDQLRDLCRRGLLCCSDESPTVYWYGPQSEQHNRTIAELASCYRELRVQIITTIYSKPIDRIQVFADAFRIRRDKNG